MSVAVYADDNGGMKEEDPSNMIHCVSPTGSSGSSDSFSRGRGSKSRGHKELITSIPKSIFRQLSRDIMRARNGKASLFDKNAIMALHAESEGYLVDIFRLASVLCKLSKHSTMELPKLQAAVKIYAAMSRPSA